MAKFNFYLGAAASAWMLVGLVIAAGLNQIFKELLKAAFSHHWIGKAVIMAAAFLAIGFLLREKGAVGGLADKDLAWYSIHGSLAAIGLFYIIEFII